jgi:putative flippase GtrA
MGGERQIEVAMKRIARIITHSRSSRFMRYSGVSVVNVVVGQSLLILAFGVFGWTAVLANVFSACIAAGPAYLMNRRWVWQKGGRSHLFSEVLPFWALALAGLGVSTATVSLASVFAHDLTPDRFIRTVMVAAAVLVAYGIVWVVRFFILDSYVFIADPIEPPLIVRSGIPPSSWD